MSDKAKTELRRAYLKKRRLLAQDSSRTSKIIELLEREILTRGWTHIASYSAIRGEVDLSSLHTSQNLSQVSWYLPKIVDKKRGLMEFYPMKADLKENSYGILEPVGEDAIAPERLNAMLVPCLGVSKIGCRLGYGGGFYDRYLVKARQLKTTGVCFQDLCQCPVEKENHDQLLHAVAHEKAIQYF